MSISVADVKSLAVRSIEMMGAGTRAEFEAVVHPDAINREGKVEPPAARGTGPDAYYATALWLRTAYADLHHEIHDVAADGDLVAIHATMSGRHVGPFVVYTEEGAVERAFAPTGKTFAVTQTHWLRVKDGQVIEHWANRDDMGMAMQLGWVPPTPLYLLRCAAAARKARKAG